MRKKYFFPVFPFIFAMLILFITLPVSAETWLEAPEKVARGDAFEAIARADEPTGGFVFFWRGKPHAAKAARIDGNLYESRILLPVPLDEKAGRLTLGVGKSGNGKTKALDEVHTDIYIYEKKRPVQKLTVDKKYVNPPAKEQARIKADREKVRAALSNPMPERNWNLPLQRPVSGSVSSQFGMKRVFNGEPRSVHKGLDLRGAAGTPIKACADGKVVLVDNLYYSGNTVYVDHGGGVFSAYLHMSKPLVKVGQNVSKGDVVGLVGATGRVTGPHLHLSLLVQGQPVDPLPLLENSSGSGGKK